MKNTKAFMIGVIAIFLLHSFTQAQPKNELHISKENFSLAPVKSNNNDDDLSFINLRAQKDFQKNFKYAKDVNWYAIQDGSYLARFSTADVKTSVAYNSRGRWQNTISYYNENKLPVDVRHLVKMNYLDYAIIGVVEVNINTETVYMVYLEDEKNLTTVSVHDGDLLEIKSYTRG